MADGDRIRPVRDPAARRSPEPEAVERLLVDPSLTLCFCESVPASAAIALIARKPTITAGIIESACAAGTGCGTCRPRIEELLARLGAPPREDAQPAGGGGPPAATGGAGDGAPSISK